jgi:hypothetical protein
MTNSHKSQSEKLAAGGGRETAAKKPHNNKVPGPHHQRDASTWAAGAGAKAPTPHRARARDRVLFFLGNRLRSSRKGTAQGYKPGLGESAPKILLRVGGTDLAVTGGSWLRNGSR